MFFSSFFPFFPLIKNVSYCQKKKKNKEVWLFVCWIKLGPHSSNYNVFGLEFFIDFFLFHQLTFDFYIKFSCYSFNCFVFGFESFIEIFFFSISSSNIWFLYQIISSFSLLLFLVFLIIFLIEIIFQFHSIWFCFILLHEIWFLFFSYLYFFLFI